MSDKITIVLMFANVAFAVINLVAGNYGLAMMNGAIAGLLAATA